MSEATAAEPLPAVQRWQAPVFGVAAARAPEPPTAAQLEAIEAAAYEEGFARGRSEGLAAGVAEARAQALRLAALMDHMAQPLAALDAEVEGALTALALQIGRRLALHELATDPARVGAIVNKAIAALVAVPREVRVHLHPEDARLLKDSLVPPAEVGAWRIVPDAVLGRGDCRICGETGWVDATIETRAAGIAQALLAGAGDGA
ncbi:MAG: flagellar assembly protein FliH [Nevskia sp.]|nr:flagellar assembly protein FliH [Nevskia sp.]